MGRHKYLLIALVTAGILFLSLPVIEFEDPTNSLVESGDGQLLSARITGDGQWRFPDCDSVPYKIGECIRYYEDQYFWLHPGINPVSLFRALFTNIREKHSMPTHHSIE